MLAEACGFTGGDIMFSSNVTPEEDYRLAAGLGATIVLDDITHIDFLDKIAGIPELIGCRFNPGGHFKLENQIMDNPQQAKYGFTRPQMTEGFKMLMQKGARHFGIHAFLSSNTVENEYYPVLAKTLFEVAVELKRETGAHISFITFPAGSAYRTGPISRQPT
jgi:diaminopimelate decarboxylase